MIKTLLVSAVLLLSLNADSCWTKAEVAEFAQDEFDDIARFSIKDAVDCRPIAGVKFSINSQSYMTDVNGMVTLPLPDDDIDGAIPIHLEKHGYITADENVMTLFGSYWNNLFVMSKELPINSARFALSTLRLRPTSKK